MGQESSKAATQVTPIAVEGNGTAQIDSRYEEYEGIEVIEPLVVRQHATEKFSPIDAKISSGELPETHKMVTDYFGKITTRINRNEEQITKQIRKQLEEYISLSAKLEQRQEDLNVRLAKILALFRTLDDEVNGATTALKSTIERADALAAQIDPELIKFQDFRNQ